MTDATQEAMDRFTVLFSRCLKNPHSTAHRWNLDTNECEFCKVKYPYKEASYDISEA